MNMAKVIASAVCLSSCIWAAQTSAPQATPPATKPSPQGSDAVNQKPTTPKEQIVVVETSMGTFKIALLKDKAPKTCDNFVKLVTKGFYNGLAFHRIIPNFMIQGGCPKGDGSGGPGYTIKAEFNDTVHVPGIVSMARTADPDSAGSQFFVCVGTCPWLDRQYTAFGKVIEGYPIVEKISKVKTGQMDRPVEKVTIKQMRVE